MGDYDVIVVGARVAGATTALLLARAGLAVLAVDRAGFPSDTLSTHQIQVAGVARLRRWGLLEPLVAAATPATRRVRFDGGGVVLAGQYPPYDGADVLYSPRRTVLDALLVDTARDAGAEVRERFAVEELVGGGARVAGIRGRSRGGAGRTETHTARLVVGADGKRSFVARAVGAPAYRTQPARTFIAYGYWTQLDGGGEMYLRPGLTVPVFPTNDGLTMVAVSAPLDALPVFRRDPEGAVLRALDRCADLGERVRSAVRVERLRLAPDLPQQFRIPYGPGWALVGDAGLVLDPLSAMGISHAFRDAEVLAEAVVAAHRAGRPLDSGLAGYHRRRDAESRSMFDFTAGLAAAVARRRPLNAGQRLLLRSLVDRPREIDRFLGVLAGIEPPDHYLSVRNVTRLLLGRRFQWGSRTRPREPDAAPNR